MDNPHRSIFSLVCTGGAVAALFAGAVPAAFGQASLTALGDLPGGAFSSTARGVSGDGSVVVGQSSSAFGDEGFRWTRAGGMVGLGVGPAEDVSADGSVVVGWSYRWTSSGGAVFVGLPNYTHSRAHGVSADGSVVVGVSYQTSPSIAKAFRWTSGDGTVEVSPGPSNDWAWGVSDDGSVVVGHTDSTAFRWTSSDGLVAIGGAEAHGVSGDGSVIVGHGNFGFGTEARWAFRWYSNDGMAGLGDLPGGVYTSQAWDVSGNGSVVVGYGTNAANEAEAYRWTSADGLRRLWDVMVANGEDPADSGWTHLEQAYAVSFDGSTIVGFGTRNGQHEAFVAVLPIACGTSDFNGDGVFGADNDIEAFFACLGGTCCATCYAGGADFNADGDSGTDQDIETFFRVLSGGVC
jgi:uncharacterized membrane protein